MIELSHRMAVMYAAGSSRPRLGSYVRRPQDPYTKALINAFPPSRTDVPFLDSARVCVSPTFPTARGARNHGFAPVAIAATDTREVSDDRTRKARRRP